MKAPHLPFSCKFNDDKTLASYANGIYDYYDVKQKKYKENVIGLTVLLGPIKNPLIAGNFQ